MESENVSNIPPDLKTSANNLKKALVPAASKKKYLNIYSEFCKWLMNNGGNLEHISESIVLSYFSHLADKYAVSTLWSSYSCLKKMLLVKHFVDLKQWPLLQDFLKQKEKTYLKKKALTFSHDQNLPVFEEFF